jgi:hypothetical protein
VFLKDPAQQSWRVLAAQWAALIPLLSPELASQRVPVAVCALLLRATAIASHQSLPAVPVAHAFNSLIALRMSGRDFPGRVALTMPTYAVGQYPLTDGVSRTAGRSDR